MSFPRLLASTCHRLEINYSFSEAETVEQVLPYIATSIQPVASNGTSDETPK